MALSVCSMFSSDWGIGITGYATPVPESGNKVYAYFAIARKGNIIAADKIAAGTEDPFRVQHCFTKELLSRLDSLMRAHNG